MNGNAMNKLQGQWMTEGDSGLAMSIEVSNHLYSHKSKFQQIDVYDTPYCGRLLTLDGVIQLTEFDEYAYHEMMTHIPLYSHPEPRRVLVIGGGDGGVLREVTRHKAVETIDICEIDRDVIDASIKFLPFTACGFDDPRVTINIADGNEFVKTRKGYYDVIIVDSTDPAGPGEPLFNAAFYHNMQQALRIDGIITSQAESVFLHPKIVIRLLGITRTLFAVSGYALMHVPTYPGGNIGACVGSMKWDVRNPSRSPDAETTSKLKYYSTSIHQAAFVLPEFAERLIAGIKTV